jgi:hypothetical protein
MKESNIIENNEFKVFILCGLVVLLVYNHNQKNKVIKPALPGNYSDIGYVNISPMKHDLFKTVTLNILPFILFRLSSTNNLNTLMKDTTKSLLVPFF